MSCSSCSMRNPCCSDPLSQCHRNPAIPPCSIKPTNNPWEIGSQGAQGCVATASCIGPNGLYESVTNMSTEPYHRKIPVSLELQCLNAKVAEFANAQPKMNSMLNSSFLQPSSSKDTLESAFYQNIAKSVNTLNLAESIAPHAAAVAAAASAEAGLSASRLAYNAVYRAKYALDQYNNICTSISITKLTPLVSNAMIAAQVLYPACDTANTLAQSIYTTASTNETDADTALTNAINNLTQLQINASIDSCNAIPGSGNASLVCSNNNILINAAKRAVVVAKDKATSAANATAAALKVALSTADALSQATLLSNAGTAAYQPFLDASGANAAYNIAFTAYANDISGNLPSTASLAAAHEAKVNADAKNALLPPLSAMNTLLSTAEKALFLTSTAAGYAKDLASSLDKAAKEAARPISNPVTPQKIALQTFAAERSGFEAAMNAARIAGNSAATPIPPPIQPRNNAVYRATVPSLIRRRC